MYRAIGVLMSLAMRLAVTAQAHGHFLFIAIVESPNGDRVAEVCFSDNAQAGDCRKGLDRGSRRVLTATRASGEPA